jgi:phage FluMu protein Com
LNEQEWRCSHCDKLLGIVCERRLHLRFARGHEYLVGFPATSVCRGCRTLNEFADPSVTPTVSLPQATSR